MATLTCVTLTIEGNAYSQKPHSVPIAVIGLGPEVAQLASRLQRGGAFRVIDSPPEAIGLALVQRRKADAIVNLDTHQLQTAQVASTLTPSCWRQIFSSPTSSLHLTATDIRPYGTGSHAARPVLHHPGWVAGIGGRSRSHRFVSDLA